MVSIEDIGFYNGYFTAAVQPGEKDAHRGFFLCWFQMVPLQPSVQLVMPLENLIIDLPLSDCPNQQSLSWSGKHVFSGGLS